MALRIKPGVVLHPALAAQFGPGDALVRIADAAVVAFAKAKLDATVTSNLEGVHPGGVRPSRHYRAEALDFSIAGLTREQAQSVRDEMKSLLGANYDVVLEVTHIHAEFDTHGAD